jgi:hypothetical protein
VLRTACQWKSLAKEGSGRSCPIHAYSRRWLFVDFFLNLWKAGNAEYDEFKEIELCVPEARSIWKR